MDIHNREGGAPPPPTYPSLPCTISEISDVESFVNSIKKLSTFISDTVYGGRSVTAANKKLVAAAAVEIRRAAELLPRIIAAEHGPESPQLTPQSAADLKSDII